MEEAGGGKLLIPSLLQPLEGTNESTPRDVPAPATNRARDVLAAGRQTSQTRSAGGLDGGGGAGLLRSGERTATLWEKGAGLMTE